MNKKEKLDVRESSEDMELSVAYVRFCRQEQASYSGNF